MRALFWFAVAIAVVALVLIPVTVSRDKDLQQNAKRIEGKVTAVDYRDHRKSSGAGRDKWWEVHVAFTDPFTDEVKERYYPIEGGRDLGVPADFPVGSPVNGFYEQGSDVVILKDELPEPGSSVKPLLIAALCAAAFAGLFRWLSTRR